jgi:hypothetical protein
VIRKSALIMGLVLFGSAAQANDITGPELRTLCGPVPWSSKTGTPPLTFEEGECFGYVTGTIYAMPAKTFCAPNGWAMGQMIDIAVKSIPADNEFLGFPASFFIKLELARAFPCPKSAPAKAAGGP